MQEDSDQGFAYQSFELGFVAGLAYSFQQGHAQGSCVNQVSGAEASHAQSHVSSTARAIHRVHVSSAGLRRQSMGNWPTQVMHRVMHRDTCQSIVWCRIKLVIDGQMANARVKQREVLWCSQRTTCTNRYSPVAAVGTVLLLGTVCYCLARTPHRVHARLLVSVFWPGVKSTPNKKRIDSAIYCYPHAAATRVKRIVVLWCSQELMRLMIHKVIPPAYVRRNVLYSAGTGYGSRGLMYRASIDRRASYPNPKP